MGKRLHELLLIPEADRKPQDKLEIEFELKLVEGVVADLGGRSPTTTLASIVPHLGTISAGEFRCGNLKSPGDGFTGIRMKYPAMTYASGYHFVGVNNDVLQVGISATDGKLYAGAGSIVVDVTGITVAHGSNYIFFEDSGGNSVMSIGSGVINADSLELLQLVPKESIYLKTLMTNDDYKSLQVREDSANDNRFQVNLSVGAAGTKLTIGSEFEISACISGSSGSAIYLHEMATAYAEKTHMGQLWVKNTNPNTLWFTDDTGGDVLVGSVAAGYFPLQPAGNIIINESGGDFNLRIESDAYTHAFSIDAGANAMGFGTTIEHAIARFASNEILFNQNAANMDFRIQGGASIGYLFMTDSSAGKVDIGGGAQGTTASFAAGGIVFNEVGGDMDFRLESVNNTHMIFVDAAKDGVGINADTNNVPWEFNVVGSIGIKERAAAQANLATFGQLWVKDDGPNTLWFTNDSGTPVQLGAREVRSVEVECYSFRDEEDCEVKDGCGTFYIPDDFGSHDLVELRGELGTAGTTGTMTVELYNATQAAQMLSTNMTFDTGEVSSSTAAAPHVIDLSNDDVNAGDKIEINITVLHTTPAKGLIMIAGFKYQ